MGQPDPVAYPAIQSPILLRLPDCPNLARQIEQTLSIRRKSQIGRPDWLSKWPSFDTIFDCNWRRDHVVGQRPIYKALRKRICNC